MTDLADQASGNIVNYRSLGKHKLLAVADRRTDGWTDGQTNSFYERREGDRQAIHLVLHQHSSLALGLVGLRWGESLRVYHTCFLVPFCVINGCYAIGMLSYGRLS